MSVERCPFKIFYSVPLSICRRDPQVFERAEAQRYRLQILPVLECRERPDPENQNSDLVEDSNEGK